LVTRQRARNSYNGAAEASYGAAVSAEDGGTLRTLSKRQLVHVDSRRSKICGMRWCQWYSWVDICRN
uniref:Secreted protein n=1 Tax=Haemonchus placei TaxID=6290 RepID=A0A0N4W987_HAEPC